jgi:hypothetical protein
MNNELKDRQIANNLRVLEPFSSMGANTDHISTRMRKRVEAMRIVAAFFRRNRLGQRRL